jgi:hypothetical protein
MMSAKALLQENPLKLPLLSTRRTLYDTISAACGCGRNLSWKIPRRRGNGADLQRCPYPRAIRSKPLLPARRLG